MKFNHNCKKIICSIMAVMLVSLLILPTIQTKATEVVTYLDWDSESKSLKKVSLPNDIVINKITDQTREIGEKDKETWYITEGETTINTNITVNGIVNLILADDTKLDIVSGNTSGIGLVLGAVLNIYGQDKGNGRLNITCTSNYFGIMNWSSGESATNYPLNIYGGLITSTGGATNEDNASGGIRVGKSNALSLYGGTVKAIAPGYEFTDAFYGNLIYYGGEFYGLGGGPTYGNGVDGTITSADGIEMEVYKGQKVNDDYTWESIKLDDTNTTKEQYVKVSKKVNEDINNNDDTKDNDDINDNGSDVKPSKEEVTNDEIKYEEVKTSAGEIKDITSSQLATGEQNIYNANIQNSDKLQDILNLSETEISKGVNVWLTIEDDDTTQAWYGIDSSVNEDDYVVEKVFNIDLFKKAGSNSAENIKETNGMLEISMYLPLEDSVNKDNLVMMRIHEGETTFLDTSYDLSTSMLSFKTDRFSKYVLVSKKQDIPSESIIENHENNEIITELESPQTKDSLNLYYYVLMLLIAGIIVKYSLVRAE